MIPRTLLSLLFHGTIPRYRDEIHLNLDQAFERFAIDDKGFARFGRTDLPSVNLVHEACTKVELAAFQVRRIPRAKRGADVDRAVFEALKVGSDTLFGFMAQLLAAELANPEQEPEQPGLADAAENFLTNLYRLIYSKEVRKYGQKASQVLAGMQSATDDVRASWDFVLRKSRGDRREFQVFYQHTQILCSALRIEFSASIWPFVW